MDTSDGKVPVLSATLQLEVDRRTLLRGALAAGVAGTVGAVAVPRAAAAKTGGNSRSATRYTFVPSGLDGGGTTSVVVADPFHRGVLLAGQDTSGLWRSSDYGRHWTPAMTPVDPDGGLFTTPPIVHIAAICFSSATPDLVYAAVGNNGNGGGLAASRDGGRSWELLSDVPQFAGGNTNGKGLPKPHPRSTGNLIQLDEARGHIYVATYRDGVMRSDDGGRSWTTLGLAGSYLRSLALDATNPDILYACPFGEHVWKTTTAGGTGSFTELPAAPATVEELVILDGVLYGAAASSGVYRSADEGASWQQLYADVDAPDVRWQSITAYADSGTTVIFAGAWQPAPATNGSGRYRSIIRSTDGGASWEAITVDPAHFHPTMGGPDGDTWWQVGSDNWPDGGVLGGQRDSSTYLQVDPFDPNRLYCSGRAGVYRTDNSLSASPDWYPCVRGLNVTFNWAVVVDPNSPNRVYIGDTDWTFLYSLDRMRHVHINRPLEPVYEDVRDIALDTTTTPSGVYVATDVTSNGEVYFSPDPAAIAWQAQGLADAVFARYGSYLSCIGLAVNRIGQDVVIVAAVDNGGVWRNRRGVWTQVLNDTQAMGPQSTNRAIFSWLPGRPIYLYDRDSGIWRSSDTGLSWTLIWAHPSPGGFGTTGFIVVPRSDQKVLYATATDGLYRLENANGATVTPVQENGIVNPGVLAESNNWLYVASYTTPGHAIPALLRRRADDPTSQWVDIADETYRAMAQLPRGLAVAPDGYIYVSQRSQGAIVGEPSHGR